MVAEPAGPGATRRTAQSGRGYWLGRTGQPVVPAIDDLAVRLTGRRGGLLAAAVLGFCAVAGRCSLFAGWRDRERLRPASLLALFFLLPLLLVYAVSFISPVFIERYLTVYALALPILLALVIDRASWLGAALFVLFVGVELVGLKNNFAVDEHDQFNVPVEFVNRNYQEDDRIVLSDMMWYLSYVYYDQTDAQLQLYTPPKPDGTPTRPNAYGFGTLVDQDGGRIYLDRLSALPVDTRRVWLISSNEAPDDFAPLPQGWRELSRQDGGGARARLFVLCNAPAPQPEGCR